jgi:hypothetical protein
MPTVDTLQAYETLRLQGGLDDKVAKAIVTACTKLLTPSFADLATKADLAEVRTDIVAMKSEIATIKANMATKAELAETKAELIKWMVGLVLAQLVAMLGLIRLLM